jgi:hypothetical protein
MRARPLLRSTPRLAAAAGLACALAGPVLADDDAPRARGMTTSIHAQPVKAVHYGDTLLHFFQDKHFSAITGLMTSQHFDRVAPQGDEAEVLRGGLLLSYGVHNEAGQIFAQLIDKGAAPSVRDRAWFYLAKIRYQRGLPAQAEAALARIEGPLPAALAEEHGLLQAQLLMARGDFAGAADVLGRLADAKTPRAGGPSLFARFNLGVALVRSGDVARGSALLDEIGRALADNEEQRSLRDRANLALGVAALQEQRTDDAARFLARVRLDGLHANKALLGFGWTAAAQQQPAKALVAWTELAARDASDPAVLEARIALPYAHAALGAYGPSLQGYEQAVSAFDSENQRLDGTIAAIRAGKLIDGLLELNPAGEMGWFASVRSLPELPHAAHLSQVLAQHEFQEAFKNVRDLVFLERNLQQWRDNLLAFRDMLTHRRQAYAARLAQTREGAGSSAATLAELRQRHSALASEIGAAEALGDGVAFADARQRGLLARVEGLQAALQTQGHDPEIAALADRVRLAAGALQWDLAQALPARRWATRKTMAAIEAQLGEATQREAALAAAQREEPLRFEQFARRIDALAAQVDATLPRVAALSLEQRGAAQQIAEAALADQKQRLVAYTTHARFEIAQLIDRATLAQGSDRASR